MFNSAAFFLVGWLVVMVVTPVLVALADKGFGLDFQDEFRKKHDGQVSRLGGIPIFFVFLLAVMGVSLWGAKTAILWPAMLLATTMIFALGLWDDFKPLGARLKLLGQLIIAVGAYFLGLRIELLTYPGGDFVLTLGGWSFPATVFWLIAIPNLINLIDGFDGLASGIGIFLFSTLGIVSLAATDVAIAYVCFAMVGALLAFLHFNFPPARIFLGDSGAYLIGFAIAALSLQSSQKGSVAAALLVTVIALGLPILDASFTLLRRAIQGFPLMAGDRGHLHHRLERVGFSKRRVVLSLYAICVVCSLGALSILWSQGRTLPIAGGALVILAIFSIRFFGFGGSWTQIQEKLNFSLSKRKDVHYAQLQGRLLALEVQRLDDGDFFWKLLAQGLERNGLALMSTGEGDIPFRVAVTASHALTLHCQEPEQVDFHQRLAEFYRPAMEAALEKWPELGRRLDSRVQGLVTSEKTA